MVNTSLAADKLVASTIPAREAAAAGFILFAMVQVRASLPCHGDERKANIFIDCLDRIFWSKLVTTRELRLIRNEQR